MNLQPIVTTERTPELAQATLEALLESEEVGLGLVQPGDWVHILTNATYDRLLVGDGTAFGRTASEVLTDAVAPRAMLEVVAGTGRTARANDVLVRMDSTNGTRTPVYLSLTFLRVRRVTQETDGVLVLAHDVSASVHERRIGELFVALASDMNAARDEIAMIRSSVKHASKALGADAASIFLLSPDAKRLHGALIGWDWTRTSFVADLAQWPNVARAIAANEPLYLTASAALLAEEAWFERRGISAAICAPMSARGRTVGVLFFDYFSVTTPQADLSLAKSVADQCARLVEHADAQPDQLPGRARPRET